MNKTLKSKCFVTNFNDLVESFFHINKIEWISLYFSNFNWFFLLRFNRDIFNVFLSQIFSLCFWNVFLFFFTLRAIELRSKLQWHSNNFIKRTNFGLRSILLFLTWWGLNNNLFFMWSIFSTWRLPKQFVSDNFLAVFKAEVPFDFLSLWLRFRNSLSLWLTLGNFRSLNFFYNTGVKRGTLPRKLEGTWHQRGWRLSGVREANLSFRCGCISGHHLWACIARVVEMSKRGSVIVRWRYGVCPLVFDEADSSPFPLMFHHLNKIIVSIPNYFISKIFHALNFIIMNNLK